MQVLFLQKRAGKAGAQVCLAALIGSLHQLGVEAKVLLGEEGWLAQQLAPLGAVVGIVPFPSWRSPLSRLLRLGPLALQVQRWGRKSGRPQLLHANDLWEAPLTEWLAGRWRRPWLVHLRTVTSPSYWRKYHLERAAAVIAVSPALAPTTNGVLPQPWHYLPDGLTEAEFFPLVPRPGRFPDHLGIMGHDHPAKGWGDVGQALALVQARGGRLPATITFFGRARPAVQAELRALFPTAIHLNFVGLVTDPLPSLWRQLDLILIPSRQESFGRTALEVIAAGVPLLASRTGIIPQLLGPESPWTFPPAAPADLAAAWQALPRVWEERWDFLRTWRQRLQEEFRLEKIAPRLVELYSKILADNL